MSRTVTRKPRAGRVSVLNWTGTLLLSAIPGVNIIAWILFIIFAKPQSKRNFAIAALLLTVIFAVLWFAAFMAFGQQLEDLAARLAESVTAARTTP